MHVNTIFYENDNCLIVHSDVKKEAKSLPDVKLEYTLPVNDFGSCDMDTQYREIGQQMKRFYFGFSKLDVETILIYLMVIYCKCFHFVTMPRKNHLPIKRFSDNK